MNSLKQTKFLSNIIFPISFFLYASLAYFWFLGGRSQVCSAYEKSYFESDIACAFIKSYIFSQSAYVVAGLLFVVAIIFFLKVNLLQFLQGSFWKYFLILFVPITALSVSSFQMCLGFLGCGTMQVWPYTAPAWFAVFFCGLVYLSAVKTYKTQMFLLFQKFLITTTAVFFWFYVLLEYFVNFY